MMKRLYCLFFVLPMLLCIGLPGFAQEAVYYEGEGYVVPTAKSMEAYRPDGGSARPLLRQGLTANSVGVEPDAGEFPEVVLHVTVIGPDGNPVQGLTADDFTVTEQSTDEAAATTQTLTCFEEMTGGGDGIDVSLVLDLSNSMGGMKLEDAKAAAAEFVRSALPDDRAALVTFSSQGTEEVVLPLQPLQTDADNSGEMDILEAIEALEEDGLTALYDGTAEGLQSLDGQEPPKALIVFTDGMANNDFFNSINDVIEKANMAGVPIFTIGLGEEHSRDNLRQMAEATGGNYYDNPMPDDMGDIYAGIALGLMQQYRLCYTTHNPVFDGTTRTVTVTGDGLTGTGTYTVDYAPMIILDEDTLALSGSNQMPGQALAISGTIIDLDARPLGQMVSGTLFYRTMGLGDYAQATLDLTDNGDGTYGFSHEIPAVDVAEPGIEYYLSATDGVHQVFSPESYLTAPHTIPVSDNLLPVIIHTPVAAAPAGLPVSLAAEISDPDGAVTDAMLHYRVHQTAGGEYMTVPMTSTAGGNYTAQIPAGSVTLSGVDYYITAIDNTGGTASSGSAENPYFIAVSDVNQPPIADAGEDHTAFAGEVVTLDGTGSSDPDPDDVLSYSWTQEGEPAVSLTGADTAQPTFVAPEVAAEGTALIFTLTVTDPSGESDTDTVRVLIGQRIPTAAFEWFPADPVQGEMIQFTDTSSSPNGAIVARSWDFSGEASSTEQAPTHAFSQVGSYTVTLTVTDEAGLTDTVSHIIGVDVRESCPDGDCGGSGGCFIDAAVVTAGGTTSAGAAGLIGLALLGLCLAANGMRGRKKRSGIGLGLMVVLGVVLLSETAFGEVRSGSVHLSPMAVGYMFDDSQDIDEGVLVGWGVGYNFTKHVGVELMVNATVTELDYNYQDPVTCQCTDDDVDAYVGHVDVLYHFRPDKRLVPYLAAGVGGVWLDYDSFDKEESAMVNYGGGVKYFFSENVALRGDVRHIYAFEDSDNNLAAGLGLTFQFGGAPGKVAETPEEAYVAPEPEPMVEKEPPPVVAETEPEPEKEAVVEVEEERMADLVIEFDFDESDIRPVYHDDLRMVAGFMKENPQAEALIEGHTDSIGSERYNVGLGRRRAESVKRYLTEELGVEDSRISTETYGESQPVAPNTTPEGRQRNRRAVIIHLVERR